MPYTITKFFFCNKNKISVISLLVSAVTIHFSIIIWPLSLWHLKSLIVYSRKNGWTYFSGKMNISIRYYEGSNIRYIYLYVEYFVYFHIAKQIDILWKYIKYMKIKSWKNIILFILFLSYKRNGFSRTLEYRMVYSFRTDKYYVLLVWLQVLLCIIIMQLWNQTNFD